VEVQRGGSNRGFLGQIWGRLVTFSVHPPVATVLLLLLFQRDGIIWGSHTDDDRLSK